LTQTHTSRVARGIRKFNRIDEMLELSVGWLKNVLDSFGYMSFYATSNLHSVAYVIYVTLHIIPEFAEDEDVVVDVDGDSDDGRVVDGLSLLAYGGEVGEGIGIGTSLAFVVVGPDTEGDGLERFRQ
jgi:hypothetical protein